MHVEFETPEENREQYDEIVALAARRLRKLAGGGNRGGRYVRTPEGARFYGQPIGTLITPDIIASAERRRGKKGPKNALSYNPITSGRAVSSTGSRPNEVGKPDKVTPHPIDRSSSNQPGDSRKSTPQRPATNTQATQSAASRQASTPRDPNSSSQDRASAYITLGNRSVAVPEGSRIIRRRDKDVAYVQTPEGDVHVYTGDGEVTLNDQQRAQVSNALNSDIASMQNYQEEFSSPNPPEPEVGRNLPDANSVRSLPNNAEITIGESGSRFRKMEDGSLYPVSEDGDTFGVPMDPDDFNFDRNVSVASLPGVPEEDEEQEEIRMREELDDISANLDSAIQSLPPEQRAPFEALRSRLGSFDRAPVNLPEEEEGDAPDGDAPDANAPETPDGDALTGQVASDETISRAEAGDVLRAREPISNSMVNLTKRDDGLWYARGEEYGQEDSDVLELYPDAKFVHVGAEDKKDVTPSSDESSTDASEGDAPDASTVEFDRASIDHIRENYGEEGGVFEKISDLDPDNDETELDLTDEERQEFLDATDGDTDLDEIRSHLNDLQRSSDDDSTDEERSNETPAPESSEDPDPEPAPEETAPEGDEREYTASSFPDGGASVEVDPQPVTLRDGREISTSSFGKRSDGSYYADETMGSGRRSPRVSQGVDEANVPPAIKRALDAEVESGSQERSESRRKVEEQKELSRQRDASLAKRNNASAEDLDALPRGRGRAYALDENGNLVPLRRNTDGRWTTENNWSSRENISPLSDAWDGTPEGARDGYSSEEIKKKYPSVSIRDTDRVPESDRRRNSPSDSEEKSAPSREQNGRVDSAASDVSERLTNMDESDRRYEEMQKFISEKGYAQARTEIENSIRDRFDNERSNHGDDYVPSSSDMERWGWDAVEAHNSLEKAPEPVEEPEAPKKRGRRGRKRAVMGGIDLGGSGKSNPILDSDTRPNGPARPVSEIPNARDLEEVDLPGDEGRGRAGGSIPRRRETNPTLDEVNGVPEGGSVYGIDDSGSPRSFIKNEDGSWISSGSGYSPDYFHPEEVSDALDRRRRSEVSGQRPVPSDAALLGDDQPGYSQGVSPRPEALSGDWSLDFGEEITPDWFDNAPSGSTFGYKDSSYLKDVDGEWRRISGRNGYFNPKSTDEGYAGIQRNIFEPDGSLREPNSSHVTSIGDGGYRPHYISDKFHRILPRQKDLDAMEDGAQVVSYQPPSGQRVNNVASYRTWKKKDGLWYAQTKGGLETDGLESSQLGLEGTYTYKAEADNVDGPGYSPTSIDPGFVSPRAVYHRRNIYAGEFGEGAIIYRIRTDKETNTTGQKTYAYRHVGYDEFGEDLFIGEDFETGVPMPLRYLNRSLNGEFFVDDSPLTHQNYEDRKLAGGNKRGSYLTDSDISPLIHPETEIPDSMNYFTGERIQRFSHLLDMPEGSIVRVPHGADNPRDEYLRKEPDGWHRMTAQNVSEAETVNLADYAGAFQDKDRGVRFESFGREVTKDMEGFDLTPDGYTASREEVDSAISALDSYDGPHTSTALRNLPNGHILRSPEAVKAVRKRAKSLYPGVSDKEAVSRYLRSLQGQQPFGYDSVPEAERSSKKISIGDSSTRITRAGTQKSVDVNREDLEDAIDALEGSNKSSILGVLRDADSPLASVDPAKVLHDAYGKENVPSGAGSGAARKQMYIDHLRGKINELDAMPEEADTTAEDLIRDNPDFTVLDPDRPVAEQITDIPSIEDLAARADAEYPQETVGLSDAAKATHVQIMDAQSADEISEALRDMFPGLRTPGLSSRDIDRALDRNYRAQALDLSRGASTAFLRNMDESGFTARDVRTFRIEHSSGKKYYAFVSADNALNPSYVTEFNVNTRTLYEARDPEKGFRGQSLDELAYTKGHFLGDGTQDQTQVTVAHEFGHVKDFLSGGDNESNKALLRDVADRFGIAVPEREIDNIVDGFLDQESYDDLMSGDSLRIAIAEGRRESAQRSMRDFARRLNELNPDFKTSVYGKSSYREFIAEAISTARFYPGHSNDVINYVSDAIHARLKEYRKGRD